MHAYLNIFIHALCVSHILFIPSAYRMQGDFDIKFCDKKCVLYTEKYGNN